MKARDLFYALWIPDLFMKRVEKDEHWTLMCPDKCQKLSELYGEEFDKLYIQYENENKGNRIVKARDLWFRILDSQMETGTPYLLYKDTCNMKSNQKNLGTIKSSNLCTEIVEYSSSNETAVCNLASIGLPAFVEQDENGNPNFNFVKLQEITEIITRNLNKIINVNFYPTQKTKNSNFRHRPIGIGVQGLADVFAMMDIYFDGEDAAILNKKIFETIYYSSLKTSNSIAIERNEHMKKVKEVIMKHNSSLLQNIDETTIEFIDYIQNDIIDEELWAKLKPIKEEIINLNEDKMGSYSSFIGSPMSEGKMQFDLWNVKPDEKLYDWDTLRANVVKYGIRNSLLLAPMPTASTT